MRAELRFYAELKDLLKDEESSPLVIHTFDVPGSVKDVIEGHGVPHTEVDLVLANGESVDFGYQVQDGDRISVYPVFETFDVSEVAQVRPEPLRDVRFVLDVHLGRLARHLRLLGFDTAYDNAWSDPELVTISVDQDRTLLTRDKDLLRNGAITHGYYVRSTDPTEQLLEVVRRFHLSAAIEESTRCLECNGVLEPVPKNEVEDRLPDQVRQTIEEFSRCPSCGRVYWKGSHTDQLARIVELAKRAEIRAS